MHIVMVTAPHGRILINASPGAGANMELVETLSLCVQQQLAEVDGLQKPDTVTMRKVLHLFPGASRSLEVPVVPIIKPLGPSLRR